MKSVSSHFIRQYRAGARPGTLYRLEPSDGGPAIDISRRVVEPGIVDEEIDSALLVVGSGDIDVALDNSDEFFLAADGASGIFDGVDDWGYRLRILRTLGSADDIFTAWAFYLLRTSITRIGRGDVVRATFVSIMGVAAATAAWDELNIHRVLRNTSAEQAIKLLLGRIDTHSDLAMDYDPSPLAADPSYYQSFDALVDDVDDLVATPLRMVYVDNPSTGVYRFWLGVSTGARSYVVTWDNDEGNFTGAEKIDVAMPGFVHVVPGSSGRVWGLYLAASTQPRIGLFDPANAIGSGTPETDYIVGSAQSLGNLGNFPFMVRDRQDADTVWAIDQSSPGSGALYSVEYTGGTSFTVTEHVAWSHTGSDVVIPGMSAADQRFSFCNADGTIVGVVWGGNNETHVQFIRVSDEALSSEFSFARKFQDIPSGWSFIRSADSSVWGVAVWLTHADVGYSPGDATGQEVSAITADTAATSTSLPAAVGWTAAYYVGDDDESPLAFLPDDEVGLLAADHPANTSSLDQRVDKIASVVPSIDETGVAVSLVSRYGMGTRALILSNVPSMVVADGVHATLISSSFSEPAGLVAPHVVSGLDGLPDPFFVQPLPVGSAYQDDRRFMLLVRNDSTSPIVHELDLLSMTVADAIRAVSQVVNLMLIPAWDESGGNPVLRFRRRGEVGDTFDEILRGMSGADLRLHRSDVYDGVSITGGLGVQHTAGDVTSPLARVFTATFPALAPTAGAVVAASIFEVVGYDGQEAITVVTDAPHLELADRVPIIAPRREGHVYGYMLRRTVDLRSDDATYVFVEVMPE